MPDDRFLNLEGLRGARLKETESKYRREKLVYLADLQERVRKVAEFRLGCTPSDSESGASAT